MRSIKDYSSIKLIKTKNNSQVFKSGQIEIEEAKKSFPSLDPKKAAQKDDMKTNLLKKNVDLFAKCTCDDINDLIRSSKFLNELKQADIVPAHKKVKAFLGKLYTYQYPLKYFQDL